MSKPNALTEQELCVSILGNKSSRCLWLRGLHGKQHIIVAALWAMKLARFILHTES